MGSQEGAEDSEQSQCVLQHARNLRSLLADKIDHFSRLRRVLTFVILVFALPAFAEESTKLSEIGFSENGLPFAVDESLTWDERNNRHMEACLSVRQEKFCASPLRENYEALDEFQDCVMCPVMVVIPPGQFEMGSRLENPPRSWAMPLPVRSVTIDYHFAVGKFEVTNEEYLQCHFADNCSKGKRLKDEFLEKDWTVPGHPVVFVSWRNAQQYADWLSNTTNSVYRVPSEAEWEYAARGGVSTEFVTGKNVSLSDANFFDRNVLKESKSMMVGTFSPNGFGLFDVMGNASEWTQDCFNQTYDGAPIDGSAWLQGDCDFRIARGGSMSSNSDYIQLSRRSRLRSERMSASSLGMRISRVITIEH